MGMYARNARMAALVIVCETMGRRVESCMADRDRPFAEMEEGRGDGLA